MSQLGSTLPVAIIQKLRLDASQRLLGTTIGITDEEWHQPSALPGWSRAHVATHLAQNAQELRELTLAALDNREPEIPNPAERFHELEHGAESDGLALQISLDTTEGALNDLWDRPLPWEAVVTHRSREIPLCWLLLSRLQEVCMHHLDLNHGFTTAEISAETGTWLLSWVRESLTSTWSGSPIEFRSSNGIYGLLGTGSGVIGPVSGDEVSLWAWLSGRSDADSVTGAGNLRLPLFA